MQATTTGEKWEKRYSPSFRDDPLRRQSSTKRKRDEVLRLVSHIWEFMWVHCDQQSSLP